MSPQFDFDEFEGPTRGHLDYIISSHVQPYGLLTCEIRDGTGCVTVTVDVELYVVNVSGCTDRDRAMDYAIEAIFAIADDAVRGVGIGKRLKDAVNLYRHLINA